MMHDYNLCQEHGAVDSWLVQLGYVATNLPRPFLIPYKVHDRGLKFIKVKFFFRFLMAKIKFDRDFPKIHFKSNLYRMFVGFVLLFVLGFLCFCFVVVVF